MKYICFECFHPYVVWQGFCNSCGQWNSIDEEKNIVLPEIKNVEDLLLSDIDTKKSEERVCLDQESLNTFLGGGLVKGSLNLLYGEPGAGKSTLLSSLKLETGNLFYISGEEDRSQVAKRLKRVRDDHDNVYVMDIPRVDLIKKFLSEISPSLIIIDSIQTLVGDDGQEVSIKESVRSLAKLARESMIPIIIIGHQTKNNALAGPNYLKHMVDVVLELKLSKQLRVLSAIKNRFGSTDKVLFYSMNSKGLSLVE